MMTLTIEIDDAGTGDPLLGAVIGFYRRETDELHFEWIPIETYQEGTYYKELPQVEASRAVMRGLLKMNIKEGERVLLCQGSIFDKARESLDKANIKHEPLKVEGKLQEAVEEEYVKAVEALGIRSKYLRVSEDDKDKGYRKRYFVLLNWAKKKPEEREKYVKNALNFWKYSKAQPRNIPGGWKKARQAFESSLESLLKEAGKDVSWDELKKLMKKRFPKRDVLVGPTIQSFGQNLPSKMNGSSTMEIHLYNILLGQAYFFVGKNFPDHPGDIIWKALIWDEEGHPVNGLIIYVKRDEYYKQHMKWFAFLREKAKKLLGNHVRFTVRSF